MWKKTVLGVVFSFVVLTIALMLGSYNLSFKELILGVTELITKGFDNEEFVGQILAIRVPRVLCCFLCGTMLALAGLLFQRVFQNPLVAPDILGTSAASALGIVLATTLGGGMLSTFLSSIVCGSTVGALALFLSLVIGRGKTLNTLVLILCGILLSSFLSSIIGVWRYFIPENGALRGVLYIMVGGFNNCGVYEFCFLSLTIFVLFIPLICLGRFLQLLALPLDVLVTQGVKIKIWSIGTLLLGTILTAVTVSVAGVIGWIALVVPNLVRLWVGTSRPEMFIISVVGGCFLVLADTLGRTVTVSEIPAGIVTGLAGIPVFLLIFYLEYRNKR